MIIVADSSALIALATCSALELLVNLYDDIHVPQTVYQEVTHPDKPQAKVLSQFLHSRVVEIDRTQLIIAVGGLGEGELEAMALYRQLNAQRLLIDDRRARRVAEVNGIACIGVLVPMKMFRQLKAAIKEGSKLPEMTVAMIEEFLDVS